MVLSTDEVKALAAILDTAIIKSKEEDDGDPVFHEVDFEDIKPPPDERTQGVVYDSLMEKGLVECSIGEDATGKISQHVCITPEGLEALKEAKGVN